MNTMNIFTQLFLRLSRMVLITGFLTFTFFKVSVNAQEHPTEHPKSNEQQMTIKDLSEAVNNYVNEETAANKGYFLVEDDKQDKTLQLTLSKVHDDRLSGLGDNEYFVCADFTAPDSTVYDIDIFMKGTSKNNLKATQTKVHKVNGKPRYTWYEENGVWKTKEMKMEIKK